MRKKMHVTVGEALRERSELRARHHRRAGSDEMALGRSSRGPYVHPRRGPANGERLNVDELVVQSCVVESSAEQSHQREWRTGDGVEGHHRHL
jgi:hypothetical protein